MADPAAPDRDDGPTVLRAGDATVTVDASDGARITSLVVGGVELLHTAPRGGETDEPRFSSGSFVMAPWAGRIRGARASWDGRTVTAVPAPDGHGLHGLVLDAPWVHTDAARWEHRIPGPDETGATPHWFAGVRLTQHLALHPDRLELTLTAAVDAPCPVTMGWHPWLRRHIDGHEVTVELPAGTRMRTRDAQGIVTGHEVPVPDGPWDDTFVGLDGPVVLRWGPDRHLTMSSDGPATVVFTGRDHAICVEPQTGPPDEVNQHDPRIVRPGRPLVLRASWAWR
ncbi:MAG: aldose 1-epimerase [Nitriliruptoraceae bacterium]|nr:aldose 1-epimerase [Nitriliruptoraceae bacterium]